MLKNVNKYENLEMIKYTVSIDIRTGLGLITIITLIHLKA
jgi:hypothetical protein